jgi:hypothetical protein
MAQGQKSGIDSDSSVPSLTGFGRVKLVFKLGTGRPKRGF